MKARADSAVNDIPMLPMSCDALSGSSALAAAAHSESQDIYKMDGLDEYVLRIGAMGVRPSERPTK